MRRLALSLMLTGMLAGCSTLPQSPPPLPDTFVPEVSASPVAGYISDDGFTLAEHSTYRVRVQTCTGYATGTAFAIDERTLVTNRHVVKDATDVTLTSYDGHEVPVTVTRVDSQADLALLTVNDALKEWLTLAEAAPAEGETVSVSGYPEGETLTTSIGPYRMTVAEVFGTDPDDVMLVQVPAAPGSSGSAIVDAESHVVGVLYAVDADEAGWSYAVSLESLQTMLADPSLLEPVVGICAS